MEHSFISAPPPGERLPVFGSDDPDLKVGLFEDEPFETYLADTKHLNSGGCVDLLDSPYHYSCRLRGILDKEEEPDHFRFGRIVHMAALEPKKFLELFTTEPEFVGKNKDGTETTSKNSHDIKRQIKEWYDALPAGALVMTPKEHKLLLEMLDCLLSHPEASNFFKNGKPEVTGRWVHERTGVRCKIRPDYLTFEPDGKYYFFDLKSARNAGFLFDKEASRLRYHVKMAFYWDGLTKIIGYPPEACALVPSQKTIPSLAGVRWMPEEAIERGRREYNHAIDALVRSMKSGEWPRRVDHGRMLEFPAYVENEALPEYDWGTNGQAREEAAANENVSLLQSGGEEHGVSAL